MAKTVCKNCGHKNPASAAVCSNCGNFLFEEPAQPQVQATDTSREEVPQQEDESPATVTPDVVEPQVTGREETILVKGGNMSQWIGMVSAIGILLAFMVIQYSGYTLPAYSIYVFLALIFLLPSALRKLGSTIKYTQTYFVVASDNRNVTFQYEDIMNVRLGQYGRASQSLTLFFKDDKPAVILDFHSFTNFRSLVMMLTRRRIPVSRADRSNMTQPNA